MQRKKEKPAKTKSTKPKQTNLFDYFETGEIRKRYGRTQHGGAETKGHRKNERPLSTKKWMHLVLKSDKAVGKQSFKLPKNKLTVESTIEEKAKKFGIKIGAKANVGNHIHLKIKISSRANFQKFLISITGLIARKVTGARKGKPTGKFWQGLAFTRVLTSSLEELNLKGYIKANQIEAEESYQAREEYLKKFNAWVYRERVRTKNLPPFSSV